MYLALRGSFSMYMRVWFSPNNELTQANLFYNLCAHIQGRVSLQFYVKVNFVLSNRHTDVPLQMHTFSTATCL